MKSKRKSSINDQSVDSLRLKTTQLGLTIFNIEHPAQVQQAKIQVDAATSCNINQSVISNNQVEEQRHVLSRR